VEQQDEAAAVLNMTAFEVIRAARSCGTSNTWFVENSSERGGTRKAKMSLLER